MSMGSRSLPPPTDAERVRWNEIKERPCLCCGEYGVEIHHILVGGLRVSHRATIGLCPWCHRGIIPCADETRESTRKYRGPSQYCHKREFHRVYGSNQELLDREDERLGWPRYEIPGRRPRKSFRPATEAQTLGGNATHPQDGTLQKRKRRGSSRGTHCQRPDKVLPRGNRIV